MDAFPSPEQRAEAERLPGVPVRRNSERGSGIQPFWTFAGGWAVVCGGLSSNQIGWSRESLLALAAAFLLVILAWAGLWNLATGSDWRRFLREVMAPSRTDLPVLPYSRPDSPGGRLGRRLSRLVGWWRDTFWPAAGSISAGCLVVILLAIVLSLLLPPSLRWLNVAVAALVALGAAQRRRGRTPPAGQSLLFIGIAWMVGYLAVAPFQWLSVAFAGLFSVAVWGLLRVAQGRLAGLWLLHGAQLVVAGLLLGLRQPLAAGGLVSLALGQILSHQTLRFGEPPGKVAERTWPWLLVAMLVAAWASP